MNTEENLNKYKKTLDNKNTKTEQLERQQRQRFGLQTKYESKRKSDNEYKKIAKNASKHNREHRRKNHKED